jgi:chemotaxis protein histidine kinase CheA
MSSPPPSFLDFFVLEASEYVEQLDALLLRAAGGRAPDAEALQRSARSLRGSATMAKLMPLAELASAVEAIGRSLKQGTLAWDASLKGVLTSTIDDFKVLVRAARTWSEIETERAQQRAVEISRLVNLPDGTPTPIATTGTAFFTTEATSIAAGLELLSSRPDDRVGAGLLLGRVRALRGVAGVKDVPALSEVLEAAESAARPLELGEARLSPGHVNLLRMSGELLRTIAAGLATHEPVTSSTPQYKAFLAALDGVVAHGASERVVPISDLFFLDKGPHIVNASTNPPTTPGQRFRMEVVSLGEHLHRVIDEARGATDAIQQEHARSELGRALRAIRSTAASFGQAAVAQTVESYLERTGDLNADALSAISKFAGTISPAPIGAPPAKHGTVPLRETHQREAIAAIGTGRPLPSFPATPAPAAAAPPAAHARVFESPTTSQDSLPAIPAAVAEVASAVSAVAGAVAGAAARISASALDATIATFESLATERLAEPAVLDSEVVPVDALFYRGRAALDRAVEVRDAIRRAGGTPAPEMLEELYDLVELARVE